MTLKTNDDNDSLLNGLQAPPPKKKNARKMTILLCGIYFNRNLITTFTSLVIPSPSTPIYKGMWAHTHSRNIPDGQLYHSRWRFLFHLSLEPRLPSACATSTETKGKGISESSWTRVRLFTACDRNCWESLHCRTSSIQMTPT